MQFAVEERLAMLGLLPQEGNLLTMKIIHDLRQELAFSEEDLEILNLKQENERLRWNDLDPKEIKVGVKAASIIHDELAKLDKDSALRESHLLLCEKFEYEG